MSAGNRDYPEPMAGDIREAIYRPWRTKHAAFVARIKSIFSVRRHNGSPFRSIATNGMHTDNSNAFIPEQIVLL